MKTETLHKGLLATLIFIGLYGLMEVLFSNLFRNDNKRKFVVGDCIQSYDPNAEIWESPEGKFIMRIEAVGKNSYLTSTFYAPGKTKFYGGGADSIQFFVEDIYRKVECP